MSEIDEWPEPDEQNGFDWSLSLKEIEKKYAPIRPTVVNIVKQPIVSPRIKPPSGTILAKFRKKYPYAYKLMEDANPDLPRWAIDNLTKIKP